MSRFTGAAPEFVAMIEQDIVMRDLGTVWDSIAGLAEPKRCAPPLLPTHVPAC
jgi:hypothetical protein